MSDEENFQKRLLEELALLFDPVIRAALDPDVAAQLLRRLGWSPDALFASGANAFNANLVPIGQAVETITQAAQDPPQSIEDLAKALDSVATAIGKLGDLQTAMAGGRPQPIADELGQLAQDLVELLTLTYLARRAPVAVDVLRLLTIVRAEERLQVVDGTTVLRDAVEVQRLDLGRVIDLIGDPIGILRNHYLPNGLKTDADVVTAVQRLYPSLGWLLHAGGATVTIGRGSSLPELDAATEALLARSLTFAWRLPDTVPELAFGTTARLIPADDQGPGVVLAPFGEAELELVTGNWQLTATQSVEVGAILVTGEGIDVLPASGAGPPVRLDSSVRVDRLASEGPALRIGSATGSRLEIGAFAVEALGAFADGEVDVGASIELGTATLVISGGDGDGFLAQVLPQDGLRAEFDLAVGWSRRKGLHVRGAAGLEASVPIHVALGPLSVDSIFLRVRAGDAGLQLAVAATAGVTLGPVQATVERIGLEADVTFPDGGGNIGPAQLELGFKPPDGAGLDISAGPVVGGGSLSFNQERQEYTGTLHLEFKGIALTAVGIITTRMPDGTDGFSMLLMISGEFTPIQLGYGFTLNGVGGLVGVNRSAALDVLRAGLKAGTLDSIMFPRDPVANAPQLISNLSAVFPPTPGRFVIGPMARLGWGTPTLLTLDLGLVLELPPPVRLAVMGRLRMALPQEKAAVVVINMDVLGVVDFGRAEASVDATLYDSRIAAFVLTGDMAMRASWGDRPGFALAVGGFHPRFQPPPGFPVLQRLALSLGTGDNPRLRLEAYLALTSNTAQFGARLELYAAALGFSIEGVLAFDALFQFEPSFSVLIEINGCIALKQGSRMLMGISMSVTLSGPSPWHATGWARFQILFVSAEISFEVRLGAGAPPALPAPEPVEELVENALKDARNWTTRLPPEGESLVTLRKIPRAEGELLVHPLGTVAVSQRVAPLGRTLERFGNARISGATLMKITGLRVGGAEPATDPIEEYFAPAQFLDLSDHEKLARPSFERWEAGRQVRASAVTRDTCPPVETGLTPESIIIDEPEGPLRQGAPLAVTPVMLHRAVAVGAAAQAPTRGPGRFSGPALELDATG